MLAARLTAGGPTHGISPAGLTGYLSIGQM
jgi:hypothetical protein